MPIPEGPPSIDHKQLRGLYTKLLPEIRKRSDSLAESYPFVSRPLLEEAGLNALQDALFEQKLTDEDAIFIYCNDAMMESVNASTQEILYAEEGKSHYRMQSISLMRREAAHRAYRVLNSDALLSKRQKALVLTYWLEENPSFNKDESDELAVAFSLMRKAIDDDRYMALCSEESPTADGRPNRPTLH